MPQDAGTVALRSLAALARANVSDVELQEAIEGIDARALVLVIDASASGQALESEDNRRGPMNVRGMGQLACEKAMYVLAAAQRKQAALETERLGHEYLTHALVNEGLALRLADTSPRDRRIHVSEWFEYAARRVPELQDEDESAARRSVGIFSDGRR